MIRRNLVWNLVKLVTLSKPGIKDASSQLKNSGTQFNYMLLFLSLFLFIITDEFNLHTFIQLIFMTSLVKQKIYHFINHERYGFYSLEMHIFSQNSCTVGNIP